MQDPPGGSKRDILQPLLGVFKPHTSPACRDGPNFRATRGVGEGRGVVNRDTSRDRESAIVGNRWFRKYCDVQRASRYFFGTDIVTLCHNMWGGGEGEGGPTHPSYIHSCPAFFSFWGAAPNLAGGC